LVRLIFPPKWEPSIVLMQVLSLGMATRMVAGSSFALLKSQGNFRMLFMVRLAYTLALLALLLAILVPGGSVLSVAIGVAVLSAALGPIVMFQAIQSYNGVWAHVLDVLARPTLCGLVAAGAGWFVGLRLAEHGYGNLAQLLAILLVAIPLNVLLAWLWMRPTWDDFWARIWRLLPERVRNAV
jgi:O-antigen/teichoic acid export membrane protein